MFINKIRSINRSLLESFLSLSVLNGLNIILPLITLPYILRIIGSANYGVYSYVYVVIQYILIITSYGFNYSSTKQISQFRNDKSKINIIYNATIISRLLLFIVCLIIVLLLSPILFKTKVEMIMIIMGSGIVLGDIINPVWLFQGMEKMRFMTFVNLASKLLFTVLIFIFIKQENDFKYIILYNSFGFILSGLLSTILAHKYFKIKFKLVGITEIKKQFISGFEIFVSSIGINLYTNANIFILNFFVSNEVLGIYSASEKIIKGFKLLGAPISQALFPHLGYKFKDQSKIKSIAELKRISKMFSFILFIISIVTFIFADQLMLIFGGNDFLEGGKLIRIMSITIMLGGLNSLLGFSGLVNLNLQNKFLISVLTSGIISIIFVILLSPFKGIVIGAWATVISELVLLLMIYYFLNSTSKN